MENVNIEKLKRDILSNFQTICRRLKIKIENSLKWDIKRRTNYNESDGKWCEKGDYYQGVLQEWVKVMYLAPNS